MHLAAASILQLWLTFCPVATILPQNQYGGGDCPSKACCADQCETNKEVYCMPSCNGKTGQAYVDCTDQCAVTFNNCYSWCANNCPGDFGPSC